MRWSPPRRGPARPDDVVVEEGRVEEHAELGGVAEGRNTPDGESGGISRRVGIDPMGLGSAGRERERRRVALEVPRNERDHDLVRPVSVVHAEDE